jgi:hypothetical protein
MASRKLGVAVDQLTVTDGVVHGKAEADKRATYAELIGGRYFESSVKWNGKTSSQLAVAVDVPLKTHDQFKVIGQSFRRRDLPGKVFGTLEYVNDVRLPGMLHARMIRPPVAGAVPVNVDDSALKDIPGAKSVWIKDFLAVVAEKEWNAVKAAKALKVTWSASTPNFPGHDKVHDHIRKAPIVKRKIQRENGNVDEGLKQAVRVIEGEYEFPTQSHASMGPACAVADVRDGGATIWTSTQKPYDSKACVAELLGLAHDKVRAIWVFGKATPPPMRRCCQSISSDRYACNTCATSSSAGIRRGPPRSTAAAPGSTLPARSLPTKTSAKRSRAPIRTRARSKPRTCWRGICLGCR